MVKRNVANERVPGQAFEVGVVDVGIGKTKRERRLRRFNLREVGVGKGADIVAEEARDEILKAWKKL